MKAPTTKADQLRALRERNWQQTHSRSRPAAKPGLPDLARQVADAAARSNAAAARKAARKATRKAAKGRKRSRTAADMPDPENNA